MHCKLNNCHIPPPCPPSEKGGTLILKHFIQAKTYSNLLNSIINIMQIRIENLGKRFNREWIFKNLSYTFETGHSYTFVGPNGSGKSTILQVISGIMPATDGQITYELEGENLEIDKWYKQQVIAAPYLELIEEFTLEELLNFHAGFKPFKKGITIERIIEKLDLKASTYKIIKNFSSGMKQRLKLALAFYADVPLVMLDEPTANLDAFWSDWYKEEVQNIGANQILLICSNIKFEYDFCKNIIDLGRYK